MQFFADSAKPHRGVVLGDAEGLGDLRQWLREPVAFEEHRSVIAAQSGEKGVEVRGQFLCRELFIEGVVGDAVFQLGQRDLKLTASF